MDFNKLTTDQKKTVLNLWFNQIEEQFATLEKACFLTDLNNILKKEGIQTIKHPDYGIKTTKK